MGLDTTHNAWHGPYSSFNSWRTWVAKQIGIDLKEMIGFGGDTEWNSKIQLYLLLNHSDCDGIITWESCKKIADALREILDKDPEDENGYFIKKTEQFITGCISAWQLKEDLEFN